MNIEGATLTKLSLRRPAQMLHILLGLILAVTVGFCFSTPNDTWRGPILSLLIIAFVSFFIIPHFAKRLGTLVTVRILVVGLLVKLVFALFRYWSAFALYGGFVDAAGYHNHGTIIAQYIWNLEFANVSPYLNWGTPFIEFFTGTIYAVTGISIFAGYLTYALFSFLGSYYFFRAFQITFPEGNLKLYLLFIFFFPSLLYWPNGISKDALIFFWLGIYAYGCALILYTKRRGIIPFIIGLAGVLWIRPHIAALLAVSFLLALSLSGSKKSPYRFFIFFVVILSATSFAWFLMPKIAAYVSLSDLSPQGFLERLQLQQDRFVQGGSAFQPIDIYNPLEYPLVLVNILFRPFPWEAHNLQALIQSAESTLLLMLVLWRANSLWMAIKNSLDNSYIRFILVFSIGIVIIFSVYANFGLLARERTMFLPFFLMLISYVPFRHRANIHVLEVRE